VELVPAMVLVMVIQYLTNLVGRRMTAERLRSMVGRILLMVVKDSLCITVVQELRPR
jgi:hypothetical protein